jgi:hypothetical protein
MVPAYTENADRAYAAEYIQQNIGHSRRSFRFETLVEFVQRRNRNNYDQGKKPPAAAKLFAA